MKITITVYDDATGDETQHSLPACWSICDRCDGHGKHDNEAFSNGISAEDFAEDEDFRADYMAGRYDVSCAVCNGSGKVAVVNVAALDAEQNSLFIRYDQQMREQARYEAADRAVRRAEGGW